MLRYLLCAWNPREPAQSSVAASIRRLLGSIPEWRVIYDRPGARVYCASQNPDQADIDLLAGGSGVVLGAIFDRPTGDVSDTPKAPLLDADATARILRSEGRELTKAYWGSYVALLHEPQGATRILRSPLADLPCFTTQIRGATICFSDVEDCMRLGLVEFSTNWNYLSRYLLKLTMDRDETGLNEVAELRGGHCLERHGNSTSRKAYWSPQQIAMEDPIGDAGEAKSLIRAMTRSSVSAWASRHARLLHRLSGGLDSSIVLGCLKSAASRPTIIGLNYFSSGIASDERDFARIAAADAQCKLVERPRNYSVDLRDALGAKFSEIPQRYLVGLSTDAAERELAAATGATAIFSGNRGDEIFLRNPSYIAADYALERGFDARLLRLVQRKADRENTSIWKAVAHTLRNSLFVGQWNGLEAWSPLHTVLSDELLASIRCEMAVAQEQAETKPRLPIGKQYHILGISEPERLYQPFAHPSTPLPIAPLLSQPIVEVCLRTPTYLLADGSWDRALARQAFAGDVPQEILQRRTKGTVTENARQVFEDNLGFARELLSDGMLVRQGLLDRRKLQDALTDGPSRNLKNIVPIFRYLNAEIWLHLWRQTASRSIAA